MDVLKDSSWNLEEKLLMFRIYALISNLSGKLLEHFFMIDRASPSMMT